MLRILRTTGSWLAFVALLVAPASAWAQPISLGDAMGHQENKEDHTEGITMFSSFDAGWTPYKANYEGNRTASELVDPNYLGTRENFTYSERKQRLLQLGPQFGVRWRLPANFSLTAALGVSYLKLQEDADQPLPGSEYNDLHHDYYNYEPNPGFSAALGVNWEAVRFKSISAVIGLQLYYLSTYGLRGHSVKGSRFEDQDPTNTLITSYDERSTTDISLHLFTIQPHLGLEWRPYSTFLVNSFGMFGAFTLSAASMTQVRTIQHVYQDNTGSFEVFETEKSNIDVTLTPVQYMGAYYAWHFSIPHFGTLGAEVQFGGRWNAIVSYQYMY